MHAFASIAVNSNSVMGKYRSATSVKLHFLEEWK